MYCPKCRTLLCRCGDYETPVRWRWPVSLRDRTGHQFGSAE